MSTVVVNSIYLSKIKLFVQDTGVGARARTYQQYYTASFDILRSEGVISNSDGIIHQSSEERPTWS